MNKSLYIKFIAMFLSGWIAAGLVSANKVSASEVGVNSSYQAKLAEIRNKKFENQRKICIAECEDILKNHPERLPSKIFEKMKVYKITNLDEEARNMFEKCKPFFDKVIGMKNEDDYKNAVREVMGYKNGRVNQTIRSLSAEEFEKLVADGRWVSFFHGERNKQRAADLRKGVPAVEDFDNNNVGCYSMYNAQYFQKASCWAYDKDGGELSSGEVVLLAINDEAILIDQDDLMRVFKRMIELYPDYFEDYLKLIKERGEYVGGYTLHPNFEHFAKFVNERAGFDFFANVDSESAKERYDKLEKEYVELVGLVKKEDCSFESLPVESLSEKQRQARADLIQLMKQHPYYCPGLSCIMELDQSFYDAVKGGSLLFNPVLKVSHDQGLLTKLWGKDAHFRVDEEIDAEKLKRCLNDLKEGKDFCRGWVIGGIFDVVNFDKVVVCADEFDFKQKFSVAEAKA